MVYLIVLLAVLARFIPHMPNFSPVYGALLFGGAHLRKRDSIWFPLLLLDASDFVLTTFIYRSSSAMSAPPLRATWAPCWDDYPRSRR
jgi:hypothetical protein